MKIINLALIGLGAVGRGFLELLEAKTAFLAQSYNAQFNVVGVATARRGSLFRLEGLAIDELLKASAANDLNSYPDQARLNRNLDTLQTLTRPGVDVVIEITPTNWDTGEPALGHVRAALAAGKHVITANKGPIALAYPELLAHAKHRDLFLGYEGTVMGGTPVLRLARRDLAGCNISEVRGIVNGTTNFILTEMEAGKTYADALADAQQRGYAEADPTADVEGFDAAGKLIILSQVIFGVPITLAEIDRKGITHLTQTHIAEAKADGQRWKLIARASKTEDGRVRASVRPERLPITDALAQIGGGINAITYQTDILGAVTLSGAGAGGRATGYAIFSDLLEFVELFG
ncbi:MAG: homoserine dehydrogenase [Anaerolineae bacterium]